MALPGLEGFWRDRRYFDFAMSFRCGLLGVGPSRQQGIVPPRRPCELPGLYTSRNRLGSDVRDD